MWFRRAVVLVGNPLEQALELAFGKPAAASHNSHPLLRVCESVEGISFKQQQISSFPFFDRAERLVPGELIVRSTTAVVPTLRAAPIG